MFGCTVVCNMHLAFGLQLAAVFMTHCFIQELRFQLVQCLNCGICVLHLGCNSDLVLVRVSRVTVATLFKRSSFSCCCIQVLSSTSSILVAAVIHFLFMIQELQLQLHSKVAVLAAVVL